MSDGADQELQRRNRRQGPAWSDRDVGQLAGCVTTDSLAVHDAALQVQEFRPSRKQGIAADAPAEGSFLAPCSAGKRHASEGSGHRGVSEPSLQTDRLVMAPSRIKCELF